MRPVIGALIQTIVALELAPDGVIDLDFEVALMEQIASFLREMSNEQRGEFVQSLGEFAAAMDDPERKALLLQMPEALGFAD